VAESKYLQNFFRPTNPQKYMGDVNNIVYRSSYERRAFIWADTSPAVTKWASEEIAIKYFDPTTNKTRRYFPDLLVEIKDQNGNIKKYLCEIKPARQTKPPNPSPKKKTKTWLMECTTYEKNVAKWNAAKLFCESNGLEFMLLTERELGIK
jgi:hypothetical protein